MRIEQRIGRIDRYGQASETVAIYNFVTPGTVDFDIYSRCLVRIGIFERAIGGSEAILGEIATRLQRVAEDFSLTEERAQHDRLQQLADNEIRQIAETEALEEREAELFGVRISRKRIDDDIAQASSRWLEPAALERLVGLHLERTLEVGRNPILGQGPVKTLRLSAEARRRLVHRGRAACVQALPNANGKPGCAAISRRLVSHSTGNGEYRSSLAFITPVHPLTQAAARAFAGEEEVHVSLAAHAPGLPRGAHPFAIYQWQLWAERGCDTRAGRRRSPRSLAPSWISCSRRATPSPHRRPHHRCLKRSTAGITNCGCRGAPRISPKPPRSRGSDATASTRATAREWPYSRSNSRRERGANPADAHGPDRARVGRP